MVEEYFYNGSLEKIKSITESLNAERVFIVHGKKSFSLSGAEEKINESCKEVILDSFNDFSPNPTHEEVLKGIELFNKEDYDLIVAVGGGSAIDVAKLINIFPFQKHPPEKYILKEEKIEFKGKPLLAVPTTAGTGSEATHFAVVYMGGKKYSVAHEHVLPDYVILDPELTFTLPKYQTACTGMDALCQGIESYWSINSTERSKEYAKKSIGLILENISRVYEKPDDLAARKNMLLGANLSGKAINISKTTAPHACSYVITSKCGIPHGHAVAIMMKEFLRYNGENIDKLIEKRGKDYYRKTISELYSLMGGSSPVEVSNHFNQKMNEIGLEPCLRNICENVQLDDFVSRVNRERLKNNPIIINRDDIVLIFKNVLA